MQFLAEKCKLGQSLLCALEELVPTDTKTRDAVMTIYKRIFTDNFKTVKEGFYSCNMNGVCFDDREYPNPEKKQFFECLVSNLRIKPDCYEFDKTSKYVKLEAIECEDNQAYSRRAHRSRTRSARISGQRRVKKQPRERGS
jgi:hypothetical protein